MAEGQLTQHFLVPQHIRLTDEQKKQMLNRFNISIKQLPMIKVTDPVIKEMNCKVGEVIQVRRNSPTAKETDYYRVVVDG